MTNNPSSSLTLSLDNFKNNSRTIHLVGKVHLTIVGLLGSESCPEYYQYNTLKFAKGSD